MTASKYSLIIFESNRKIKADWPNDPNESGFDTFAITGILVQGEQVRVFNCLGKD